MNSSAKARDLSWERFPVDSVRRARMLEQTPCVLWFTGLSGAGKSTLASLVETHLFESGRLTYLLDGDNMRHGLCRDLDFSAASRAENIRRVGEVSRLFIDAGLIVLTAFISPFREDRDAIRQRLGPDRFVEIFVSTPLKVCEMRDIKGLYQKAREGVLQNFTGIDSPYEPPLAADLVIDTSSESPSESAARVISYLEARGLLRPDLPHRHAQPCHGPSIA